MTAPLPYGYVGRVHEVDPFSHTLIVQLGRRNGDGWLAVNQIGGPRDGVHIVVADGEAVPPEAYLRIPLEQADALWRLLCHHFGDGPPGEHARADLLHERGRVDKLIDAMLAPPLQYRTGPPS